MKKLLSKNNYVNASGEINLLKLFCAALIIPTLISAIYYYIFASDIYISETQFSIYSNEQKTGLDLGNLAQLASGNYNTGSLEQLLVVEEYLKSFDLLQQLDKELNLKKLYSTRNADYISRLKDNPTNDEFLEYYRDQITVTINRESSVVHLKVRAFTAEESYIVVEKISQLTENFINEMLARVKAQSLKQAQEISNQVQEKIKNIQLKLVDFRIKNGVLDPLKEIEVKVEFIKALETTKAELEIKLNSSIGMLNSNSMPILTLKQNIKNIEEQIQRTKNNILDYQQEFADIIREHEMLKADEKFAENEYKIAMINLEETIKKQTEKNKYIVQVLKPVKPDEALEPERIKKVIVNFIITFLSVGVIGLMVASIRDHMVG